MTVLYAMPYDLDASGFYFENLEEYQARANANRNRWGWPVEEYEIQFIDGDAIDACLFEALCVHQGTFAKFLAAYEDWDEDRKRKAIIAVGECGYAFEIAKDHPDDLDIDIYEFDSLRELAEHFVDEGLFGEIPERIQWCLDFDAIARDLRMDYAETVIAGKTFVYRCS